ncbi:DUF1513 domain-containing protein [Vibrio comitans]|uniref:Lipoprotein n=1 Tax=Vibrio comitans NBRC 102076 TaxID=1219078 RepID=A0A4Y3IRN0_9VIBR|nr:DUF1513 domain-containing protein [Vibrio comitans]GEA61478.1 hypothetical protein VCO01S_26710 [Vibrio comitans NBRC 102076]
MINRRTFLKSSSALGITLLPGCAVSLAKEQPTAIAGCATDGKGNYFAAAVTPQGKLKYSHPLPARGHGLASNTTHQHLAVIARRQGQFVDIISLDNGQLVQRITPVQHRFFYGHAAYSSDSETLYVSEGETHSCKGVIGIYDVAKDYQRIGKFSNFGIGPHQIEVLSNGDLVVAVGGIQTQGRKKINLDSMHSTLVTLNKDTGKITSQAHLEDPLLSIRHIAVTPQDQVFVGVQSQAPDESLSSLVFTKTDAEYLNPLPLDTEEWLGFEGYIGSLAVTDTTLIVSSPRGNRIALFDRQTGKLKQVRFVADGCALASTKHNYYIVDNKGTLYTGDEQAHNASGSLAGIYWDNHWIVI